MTVAPEQSIRNNRLIVQMQAVISFFVLFAAVDKQRHNRNDQHRKREKRFVCNHCGNKGANDKRS